MKLIIVLSAVFIGSLIFAQDEKSGFTLDNFNSSIGFTMSNTNELSLEQLNQLAPESELLNEYSFLLGNPSSRPGSYSNGLNEVQLNVSFRHNKRTNHRLQFGLTYQNRYNLGRNNGISERYTIDSLESQEHGTTYAVDSLSSEGVTAAYSSDVVKLMVSYRIHGDINDHWSLYGGLGLTAGLTFNNRTRIFHYEYSSTIIDAFNQNPSTRSIPVDNLNYERELIDNNAGFSVGAFVPLGLAYTIGDWDSKVNTISIFLEAQPGYFAQYVPELNSFSSAFYFTQNIGVRIGL